MNKKIFTLALGLAAFAMSLMAQNNLNIYPKEGEPVTYAFIQNPKITYEGANLIVTVAGVKVSYPLSNLRKFTFEDIVSGICSPTIVSKSDSPIYIYNVNGVLVKTINKENDDNRLSLDDLQRGIYVIKNGKVSYKITIN